MARTKIRDRFRNLVLLGFVTTLGICAGWAAPVPQASPSTMRQGGDGTVNVGVWGCVRRPGVVSIAKTNASVITVLTQVDGFLPRNSPEQVMVARRHGDLYSENFILRLSSATPSSGYAWMQGASVTNDFAWRNGDILVVPNGQGQIDGTQACSSAVGLVRVRLRYFVVEEGCHWVSPNALLFDIIKEAGGLREEETVAGGLWIFNGVAIFRREPDGSQRQWRISAEQMRDELLTGKSWGDVLENGDELIFHRVHFQLLPSEIPPELSIADYVAGRTGVVTPRMFCCDPNPHRFSMPAGVVVMG